MKHQQQTVFYLRKTAFDTLENIFKYPLTVVVAPMGYGKTTVVREFIKLCKTPVLWKPITGSSQEIFWNGLVRLIGKVDACCASKLEALGFPGDSILLDEAVYILQSIELKKKTVLVFDDWHLLKSKEADVFIETLIRAEINNLHVVIISRAVFGENSTELFLKSYAFVMDKSKFSLSREEITEYYRLNGIPIGPQQAEKLFLYSEGWFSALYLCLLNYRQHGKFEEKIKLYGLVAKLVYDPLPEQLKEFLLAICVFDNFTQEQATFFFGADAPRLIGKLLEDNAFVSYNGATDTYQLHSILNAYLRGIFGRQPDNWKKELWQRAGKWHLKTGEYTYAYSHFYQAGAFEVLLSAFESEAMLSTVALESVEKFNTYFSACPQDIKDRHPRARLLYAINLFTYHQMELYTKECRELGELLAALPDGATFGGLGKDQLAGELEILLSFTKFNKIKDMSEHHQRAFELLQSPSGFFSNKGSWTMDCPSVMCLFYRESGHLAEAVTEMNECLPYYYKITGGHGMGAEYAMQAEYFYNTGNFKKAEIYAHQAFYSAKEGGQVAIVLCSLFLQMRLALLEGNLAAGKELLGRMEDFISKTAMYSYIRTYDLCRGFFYAYLGLNNKVPDWILTGQAQENTLPFICETFYNIIYGKILLNSKKYSQLLGNLPVMHAKAGVFSNLLANIYFYIYQAEALAVFGEREKAAQAMENALALAAPDLIVMPFVENSGNITTLINSAAQNLYYRKFAEKILMTAQNIAGGLQDAQRMAQNEAKPIELLSDRERRIAELAALGLSNHEIGKELFIAEVTVKKNLQNIYAKWGINNKIKLAKIVLQNFH